jgi:hypothetical protein
MKLTIDLPDDAEITISRGTRYEEDPDRPTIIHITAPAIDAKIVADAVTQILRRQRRTGGGLVS